MYDRVMCCKHKMGFALQTHQRIPSESSTVSKMNGREKENLICALYSGRHRSHTPYCGWGEIDGSWWKTGKQANDRDKRTECLSNAIESKITLETRETSGDTQLTAHSTYIWFVRRNIKIWNASNREADSIVRAHIQHQTLHCHANWNNNNKWKSVDEERNQKHRIMERKNVCDLSSNEWADGVIVE